MGIVLVLPAEVATARFTRPELLVGVAGINVSFPASRLFEHAVASFECTREGCVSIHVGSGERLV